MVARQPSRYYGQTVVIGLVVGVLHVGGLVLAETEGEKGSGSLLAAIIVLGIPLLIGLGVWMFIRRSREAAGSPRGGPPAEGAESRVPGATPPEFIDYSERPAQPK